MELYSGNYIPSRMKIQRSQFLIDSCCWSMIIIQNEHSDDRPARLNPGSAIHFQRPVAWKPSREHLYIIKKNVTVAWFWPIYVKISSKYSKNKESCKKLSFLFFEFYVNLFYYPCHLQLPFTKKVSIITESSSSFKSCSDGSLFTNRRIRQDDRMNMTFKQSLELSWKFVCLDKFWVMYLYRLIEASKEFSLTSANE